MKTLEQAIKLFSLQNYDFREGEELDYEDIENAAESLIHEIPYAGINYSI